MADFFQSYIRWSARVGSYFDLLVAEYPPFDGQPNTAYPIDVEFPGLTDLNRAAVFFRIIIAIPAYAMAAFLGTGLFVFIFPFWICALILGRLPDPVYRAVGTVTRFQVRLQAYMLMVTPEYPWGWKGDDAGRVGADAPSTNGTTRFDFVLVGAAQVWIWIWIVFGVIYELFFRRR
jgi:phage terminase large subunit-like protein